MKKSGKRDDEYPTVHSWNYITVEGYCMLNMEFGMCKDRYVCELKPDGSFKRKKNDRYDPTKKPDPFPEGCPRSIQSVCIGCQHFAWCDPDHPGRTTKSVRPRTTR
ncbi:MAG: hypothetical protein WCE46_03305 [Methanoregula sp.]|uniref:hypothetical protein n=1 Tax=Methanoregula sp. TaxID=2052170 RepID=UPI003C7153A3